MYCVCQTQCADPAAVSAEVAAVPVPVHEPADGAAGDHCDGLLHHLAGGHEHVAQLVHRCAAVCGHLSHMLRNVQPGGQGKHGERRLSRLVSNEWLPNRPAWRRVTL